LFEVVSEKRLPLQIKHLLSQWLFFLVQFNEAAHGTPTVLKRDPRHNFIENIAFLGLSVGLLKKIIMKSKYANGFVHINLSMFDYA
jgi:hypothetical protein